MHSNNNKTTHPCGGAYPPPLLPPPTKNDIVSFPIPSLQPYRHNHDPHHHRNPPFMVTTTVTAAASSWLRNRRIRYIFLLLFSPLLLVLLLVSLPFLCAAEVCLRHRLWRKLVRDPDDDDRIRRCEEGCCGNCNGHEEKGLLHRYLEDQLLLVRSMYDCGDDDDDDEEQYDSRRRVGDIENLCSSSSRIPLLR